MTKYYGRSKEMATRVVDAFKTGNLPKPLSQVFISKMYGYPSAKWSFRNQFICAISGCTDARGFKQWKEVGRHVRRKEDGGGCFVHILFPLFAKKEDEEGNEKKFIYGYKSAAVYDISQTDGDDLPEVTDKTKDLPLLDVAKEWDITVTVYPGEEGRALGQYSYGSNLLGQERNTIALGVENHSTWVHEMIHAADKKLGNLTVDNRKWANETVAELGGATLLTMIGEEYEADLGGAWKYINSHCESANKDPVKVCGDLISRTSECIALILETAGVLPEEEEEDDE